MKDQRKFAKNTVMLLDIESKTLILWIINQQVGKTLKNRVIFSSLYGLVHETSDLYFAFFFKENLFLRCARLTWSWTFVLCYFRALVSENGKIFGILEVFRQIQSADG